MAAVFKCVLLDLNISSGTVKLVTSDPGANMLTVYPHRMAQLEEASMTRTEYFVTASSEDRQFIRRWTLRLPAFYGILAVTVVTLSFVLHAPKDTTVAGDTLKTHHAILVR